MAGILFFAALASLVALAYAAFQSFAVLKEKPGNKKMQDIAYAIHEGANAFIKREYKTVFAIAFIIAIAIGLALPNGWILALGFAIGAIGSAIAGYIGIMISVRANVRVAKKAEEGLQKAFRLAFRGGSVTGFAIVGFALLSLTLFYYVFRNPDLMFGFMFGASLISLFARVGGGIYTKGADVGADLVGKVGLNLPEDDPRNPAVIADNVGDNVGDCAGMGADLYETYVVTIISAMALAFALHLGNSFIILPLAIGAIAILATLIGLFFAKVGKNNYIMGGLYKGVAATAIIAIIGFYFIIDWLTGNASLFYASAAGIAIVAVLIFMTEYYTGDKFNAVKSIAKESKAGAGVTVISGLGYGLRASFIPMVAIAGAILFSYGIVGGSLSLANFGMGVYGIAITAVAMLSVAGMILSVDAFGPITDNAGGIAEMAGLPEKVRDITDPLDAVGNTTKAITKAYAIGSAAVAALALFAAYEKNAINLMGSSFADS
ncbi:MAG: sodium-translocating pyrophosphatase, partial [Candidatus Micrarchaeaceae archaeon]